MSKKPISRILRDGVILSLLVAIEVVLVFNIINTSKKIPLREKSITYSFEDREYSYSLTMDRKLEQATDEKTNKLSELILNKNKYIYNTFDGKNTQLTFKTVPKEIYSSEKLKINDRELIFIRLPVNLFFKIFSEVISEMPNETQNSIEAIKTIEVSIYFNENKKIDKLIAVYQNMELIIQ